MLIAWTTFPRNVAGLAVSSELTGHQGAGNGASLTVTDVAGTLRARYHVTVVVQLAVLLAAALVFWAALSFPANRLAVRLELALTEHAREAWRTALAGLAGIFGGNRISAPEEHAVHVAHSVVGDVEGRPFL